MTNYYISHGLAWVDDGLVDWTEDSGLTATSDGDKVDLSGTAPSLYYTSGTIQSGTILFSDYPVVLVRGKVSTGTENVEIGLEIGASWNPGTIALTSSYQLFLLGTADFGLVGTELINRVRIGNFGTVETHSIDFIGFCKGTLLLPISNFVETPTSNIQIISIAFSKKHPVVIPVSRGPITYGFRTKFETVAEKNKFLEAQYDGWNYFTYPESKVSLRSCPVQHVSNYFISNVSMIKLRTPT